MAAIRGQASEIRGQRSAMRKKPFFGMKQHRTKQLAHFGAERGQFWVLGCSDVAAIEGEIEARVSLGVFTVGIGQLGNEMGLVAPLCPRFRQVEAYRTRGTANLTGERKLLLRRKRLTEFEHSHRQFI